MTYKQLKTIITNPQSEEEIQVLLTAANEIDICLTTKKEEKWKSARSKAWNECSPGLQLTQMPFHIGALCLQKILVKEGPCPGTAATFYPHLPLGSREVALTLQWLGQDRELRVLLVSENSLPFHLEMLPTHYSISSLQATKLFLFHPHQNQDERVSPYIFFCLYIFQITPVNSTFVTAPIPEQKVLFFFWWCFVRCMHS